MKLKQRSCEPITSANSNVNRRERRRVHLVIGTGEVNLPGLRSITRDWLVPRLVEEFVATRRRDSDLSLKRPKKQ
jgi:hypothetical protein